MRRGGWQYQARARGHVRGRIAGLTVGDGWSEVCRFSVRQAMHGFKVSHCQWLRAEEHGGRRREAREDAEEDEGMEEEEGEEGGGE
eukprot:1799661-Rhodomonas_salina.1